MAKRQVGLLDELGFEHGPDQARTLWARGKHPKGLPKSLRHDLFTAHVKRAKVFWRGHGHLGTAAPQRISHRAPVAMRKRMKSTGGQLGALLANGGEAPACETELLQHHNAFARLRELASHNQPANARADHHHVEFFSHHRAVQRVSLWVALGAAPRWR